MSIVRHLRINGPISIKKRDVDAATEWAWQLPKDLPVSLPADLGWKEIIGEPEPRLLISKAQPTSPAHFAKVVFYYDRFVADMDTDKANWFDKKERIVTRRNRAKETELFAGLMREAGVQILPTGLEYSCTIDPTSLQRLVPELEKAGWAILAEGKRLRFAGAFKGAVTSSGVDWFELNASFDYGGEELALPKLLAAVKRGESFIRLGDGSVGLLPEEWLKANAGLTAFATPGKENLRYRKSQVMALDALIDANANVSYDSQFGNLRERLRGFSGVAPLNPAPGFLGQLRPYQAEGLGWLGFLNEFGFGGCLADDMGLGKTVQVLAMLHRLKTEESSKPRRPTLIVVPRSLVYNWADEAARFTPDLKILVYSSPQRHADISTFDQYDIVITTYAIMRLDLDQLSKIEFRYVILDEAQNIKNENAQTTKAACQLRGEQKLALSGTPIENHVGELASVFEFLNPGMLGNRSQFQGVFERGSDAAPEAIAMLSKVIRPFVLRRTKGQVLKDLPEKVETTLHCTLLPKHRAEYEQLRDHFRAKVKATVKEKGMNGSKIHVLEALLRLRQAACHPGLIDPSRTKESSAKLDLLMEQLEESLAGGHKALVFSQFVSLLSVVRQRLDKAGIYYEYLDGKTTDRKSRVERFQSDAKCPVFLISLKAGGLGLNLTAADTCFILDPWWNPAAEAQAIDRAHRMGQTKSVFAYRIIAQGTIEEKILELQKRKRNLADAIITADSSFLSKLTLDDLEYLMS